MDKVMQNQEELFRFGAHLGASLKGGEILELIGDVGAGKTTLVKAIALGMGITDSVSSPSYTLSQTYQAPDGRELVHYDFYRLDDPGILRDSLEENMMTEKTVIAVEWSDIIADALPADRLRITITPRSNESRSLLIMAGGRQSTLLLERLQ